MRTNEGCMANLYHKYIYLHIYQWFYICNCGMYEFEALEQQKGICTQTPNKCT